VNILYMSNTFIELHQRNKNSEDRKKITAEYEYENEDRIMPAIFEFYEFCEIIPKTPITPFKLANICGGYGYLLFDNKARCNLLKKIPNVFHFRTRWMNIKISMPYANQKIYHLLNYSPEQIKYVLDKQSFPGLSSIINTKDLVETFARMKEFLLKVSETKEDLPYLKELRESLINGRIVEYLQNTDHPNLVKKKTPASRSYHSISIEKPSRVPDKASEKDYEKAPETMSNRNVYTNENEAMRNIRPFRNNPPVVTNQPNTVHKALPATKRESYWKKLKGNKTLKKLRSLFRPLSISSTKEKL